MNIFERILYFLQGEMHEPKSFGWFHLFWLAITILSIFILYKNKKKYNEKQLKCVLGIYGIIALILEVLKQLIWTFNFDPINNTVIWKYEWYAAPFQLCTTPIYVSIICLFLKDTKIRKALLSYLAYITILGSFLTIIIPDSCFVNDILVNIHTMWLHCGSFVVSVYLIMNNAIKIKENSQKDSYLVFLIFVFIAEILNISIYNSGILKGDTFNMFYISPYFTSSLPVFNIIQENVPFILFLLIYLFAIYLGSLVVYYICKYIKKVFSKKNKLS